MKVGIGYSNEIDGLEAGKIVAENALKNGKIENPHIVITFCGGQVDHNQYFEGLKTVLGGDIPIIGGSAIGTITNNNLSYEGFPAAAAILESENLQFDLGVVGELEKNEKKAGQRLGKKLSKNAEGKLLLIFYDSVKKTPTELKPPEINASPSIIEGIEDKLGISVPIIGAGVVGNVNFQNTKQFCGSYVGNQSLVGMLLNGNVTPHFRIMHGCIPKDGIYHRVTKAEGAAIYELDGRPIVQMIDEQYGNDEWRGQFPISRLTLAVNHGDKFEDFQETNYVNRLISGVLPGGKGVMLFEPDLQEGDEVQFMLRNGAMMMDSVRKNTGELFEEIISNGEKPVFGLYIDCAGRTSQMSDTFIEEASEVQHICNQYDVPLIGFYSGVEIAPVHGKSRGLDWTGVLLVLAEK